MVKSIVDTYENLVAEKYGEVIDSRECESFKKVIKTKLSMCGYLSYFSHPKCGSMFYNASIKSGGSIKLVYKLLNITSNNAQPNRDPAKYVRNMIKRQVALSKRSIDFDYRELFEPNMCDSTPNPNLEKYIDPELLKFLDDVTMSESSLHAKETSIHHNTGKKLKCIMISAIMANCMDPRSCFLQTLLGLSCYAQGLRDKGVKLLNAFGVTCSVFHIRQHGSFWAKMRDAVKEINPHACWRVTFDNLDFRMKFAKNIMEGGHLKRMLHLLTSQVSFRVNCNNAFNDNTSLRNKADLNEYHFKIEHDNKEWLNFANSTFNIMFQRVVQGSSDPIQPLLTELEKHMPQWTPDVGDKIVYTTVDEAHSGSIDDVGSFLLKLKECILECLTILHMLLFVVINKFMHT